MIQNVSVLLLSDLKWMNYFIIKKFLSLDYYYYAIMGQISEKRLISFIEYNLIK